MDNAIKYAAKSEQKQVDISFRRSAKKYLTLSVRDYGPGIAKDEITQVSDLFYRTGNELTREVTGTGIGLALVKELVNAMKAKIEVINHKIGVEFSLKFSIDK